MFASGMHFSTFSSQGLYNTNLLAYKAIMYIYTGFLLLYKWIYERVSYINIEMFASGIFFSIFSSQGIYNTICFAYKAIMYIYTDFLVLHKWIYESVSYINIMKSVLFLLLAAD